MPDVEIPDGTYTAVVDSIEDGFATVFFEYDGEEIGDAVFDVTKLPDVGRHADAIFSITVESEDIIEWEYRERKTEQRKEAAQNRFDRLSERPSSDEE